MWTLLQAILKRIVLPNPKMLTTFMSQSQSVYIIYNTMYVDEQIAWQCQNVNLMKVHAYICKPKINVNL